MVLLGSSTLMADTLEKSFKSGAIEGSDGAFGQQFDHKNAPKDTVFQMDMLLSITKQHRFIM